MVNKVWKKDDVAVFIGYSDPNIAEADQLLRRGERVRIHSVEADALAAVPIVGEGEPARDGDTVFPDEIVTVEDWTAMVDAEKGVTQPETVDAEAQADAEAAAAPNKTKATETAKKISKGKGKGKAKTAAATTETEAEANAPAETPEQPQAQTEDDVPEVLEVAHSSSVQSLLAEKDALEAAKELVNRAEETDYTLGGVLAHIQLEGIHQRLGYSGKRGFEDYIEQELGVKYRKAMYLIRIYTHFNALGIDETKLAAMGWSKAKELVGVATKENFDELADYAQKNTRDALIEHIKTSYVNAGDGTSEEPKAKLTRWTFNLFDDQNTTVNRAIEAAKTQAQTENISAALEFICAEWSLMSENNSTTLEEQIELMEARFGVKLQVVEGNAEGQTDDENTSSEQAA